MLALTSHLPSPFEKVKVDVYLIIEFTSLTKRRKNKKKTQEMPYVHGFSSGIYIHCSK